MGFHLTPAMVETAYELLRMTPPFNRWKLPHADDLAFEVTGHEDRFGSFHFDVDNPGKERLTVSAVHVKSLDLLQRTLAHEMCHIREWRLSPAKAQRANHGKLYNRLADQVCKRHGFERGTF